MRLRTLPAAVALAAASVIAGPAANATPIDSGHFTDSFTETFDCDGTPTQHDSTATVQFTFNQRGGKNVFPYYRESVNGTDVFTNLETGGTYSNHFTANSRDHKIVDNGDGTITIYGQGSGTQVWRDQFNKVVLKDTGQIRYAIDIDYNGTPGNPDDDTEVPDSFRIVRNSTGTNIVDRDFCEDLVLFTS